MASVGTRARKAKRDEEEFIIILANIPPHCRWQDLKDILRANDAEHIRQAVTFQSNDGTTIGTCTIKGHREAHKAFESLTAKGWNGHSIAVSLAIPGEDGEEKIRIRGPTQSPLKPSTQQQYSSFGGSTKNSAFTQSTPPMSPKYTNLINDVTRLSLSSSQIPHTSQNPYLPIVAAGLHNPLNSSFSHVPIVPAPTTTHHLATQYYTNGLSISQPLDSISSSWNAFPPYQYCEQPVNRTYYQREFQPSRTFSMPVRSRRQTSPRPEPQRNNNARHHNGAKSLNDIDNTQIQSTSKVSRTGTIKASRVVHICGLPPRYLEHDLEVLLRPYGPVECYHLQIPQHNDPISVEAIAKFLRLESADEAVQNLDGHIISGKRIRARFQYKEHQARANDSAINGMKQRNGTDNTSTNLYESSQRNKNKAKDKSKDKLYEANTRGRPPSPVRRYGPLVVNGARGNFGPRRRRTNGRYDSESSSSSDEQQETPERGGTSGYESNSSQSSEESGPHRGRSTIQSTRDGGYTDRSCDEWQQCSSSHGPIRQTV